MRWLLVLLLAGNAAARTRCNQKKLPGIEDLPVEQLITLLLYACPEPPSYLATWLHLKPGYLRAELILLDARDAYVKGDYEGAMRIARFHFSAAPETEEWLIANGLPKNRAHQLAITIDPRPPAPDGWLERDRRIRRDTNPADDGKGQSPRQP